jgi:NitT/TauT family transport system permease protein
MNLPTPTSRRTRIIAAITLPLISLLIVLTLWQVVVTWLQIPRFQLPKPTDIARAAFDKRVELTRATGMTAVAAGVGFALSLGVGSLIGILFSQSRAIARSVYPYAIFLQTVPIVAIAPIIINWFGTGLPSVIVVSFIISLFPIITGAYAGLMTIDPNLLELFALHNATRWQLLTRLRLPSAVPSLITGAKVSAGLAVIGAIVGEFFAGATNLFGLGYLIPQALGQLEMDYGFAAVICSALLGLIMFGSIGLLGSLLLRRLQMEQR